MKLLLIFPAWCSVFGSFKKVAKKSSSFPPLSLCYIASIAENQGWQVKILDAELQELGHSDIINIVSEYSPDLVGMTATTPFFGQVSKLAESIKSCHDIPIIVGGVHVSLLKQEAFLDVFDYLFIGECEEQLPEFLRSFSAGKRGEGIPGIMRREHGKIIFSGNAPPIVNLDSVPRPARHLLDYKDYYVGTLKGKKNYTSIMMSRGCPFNCVFCANDLYGKKVRRRSIENVANEIEHIINELGIRHLYFLDDTLTLNQQYLFDLCDEIEKRNLIFTFEGSTRANLWNKELVQRLKQCGLIRISFGLETVDPQVRNIIKKEVPLDSYIESNKLNKKYGIETINSVMLGLPGETRESIKKTVNFLCHARDIEHTTYGIAIPYPGTELYRMAEKGEYGLKLLTKDFSKYQRYDSAVMQVNDIKPEEIIRLQKLGLMKIYLCWWRIWPMIKRHGLISLIFPALGAINSVFSATFTKLLRPERRRVPRCEKS